MLHFLLIFSEFPSNEDEAHDTVNKQYWQAAIFKVGDDVRQVNEKLAVQRRSFRGFLGCSICPSLILGKKTQLFHHLQER